MFSAFSASATPGPNIPVWKERCRATGENKGIRPLTVGRLGEDYGVLYRRGVIYPYHPRADEAGGLYHALTPLICSPQKLQ